MPIHWSQVLVENEGLLGAAPTGDAPNTSEWSTSLLPTKVQPTLEVWRKLNVSMACQRLKSPQSLWGTPTHPTRVTPRWPSWSWMINSYPFCLFHDVGPPIPEISRDSKLFTFLWVPRTHRPWSLWVWEHWEWVDPPSLMILFVGNFKMCPQDTGS